MISDTRFSINGFVPMRLVDAIQRATVLYPLVGPAKGSTQVRAQASIRKKTQQLVAVWRARLGALAALGWTPHGTANPHAVGYCRNCMPTFVAVKPLTRSCRLNDLCPFCWARSARKVWLGVDSLFHNTRRGLQAQVDAVVAHCDGRNLRAIQLDEIDDTVFPFHLIEQKHTTYVSTVPETFSPQWSEAKWIGVYMKDLVSRRKAAIFRRVEHHGAFSLTTVEPVPRGWRVCHRRLYKVLADYPTPEDIIHGKVTRHECPTRAAIFGAVARVCRYPVLLLRGDVDRTLQWLDARRTYRMRLQADFGALRRRKQTNEQPI